MANTVSITGNNYASNAAPTGKVNCASGVSNPIQMAAQANQQILVGDVLIQNNSSNTFTAIPATNASCAGDTSNTASNNALQLYIANNFAGFSTTYRSPKNTSSGKPADIVGVATGRMKLPVNPANSTAFANNTGVGTFWGVACTQNNQFNGTSTPLANNAWVLPNLYDIVANNTLALGKQALPKAANDPYVWVDCVSKLVAGGIQT